MPIRPADNIRTLPNLPEQASERADLRKRNSKTFQNVDGSNTLIATVGDIHYKKQDGTFDEIDLEIDGSNRNLTNGAEIIFDDSTVKYSWIDPEYGEGHVELEEIGNAPPNYAQLTTRREGNKFYWDGVTPTVDMYAVVKAGAVELFKIIKNSSGDKIFKWGMKRSIGGQLEFQTDTKGWDSTTDPLQRKGKSLEINHTVTLWARKGQAETRSLTEEVTGRVSRILDKQTRQREWRNDAVYPLTIDLQINPPVTGSSFNDVTQTGGSVVSHSNPGSRGFFGESSNVLYDHGDRWENVALPQGATVSSAYIRYTAKGVGGGGAQFDAKLEQGVAEAGAVFSNSNRPSQINAPLAFALNQNNNVGTGTWTVPGATMAVQNVVGLTGWSSGAHNIRLWLDMDNIGGSVNTNIVGDVSIGDSAVLVVVYTTGGGGTWPTGNVFSRPFTGPFGGPI